MPSQRAQRPSPAQDSIVEFLKEYKTSNDADGNSPTYQEIADALGISYSAVFQAVRRMEHNKRVVINSRGKITFIGGKYDPPDNP